MLELKKVAVTGSLASGKSTVCRIFEELGAYVVDADAIVHQLLIPNTAIGQKIIELLGDGIVADGKIKREEIAKLVFSNPDILKEVERQIHPEVQNIIEKIYRDKSNSNIPLFLVEVPLLFEAGWDKYFESIIVVCADKEKRKKRFMQRPSYDEKEFERRERRFMPIENKLCNANFVIENNEDLSSLRNLVKIVFNSLIG